MSRDSIYAGYFIGGLILVSLTDLLGLASLIDVYLLLIFAGILVVFLVLEDIEKKIKNEIKKLGGENNRE